jgi:hypothetical protein
VTEDDGTQGNGEKRNEAGMNVSRVIKNMAQVGRKRERIYGY